MRRGGRRPARAAGSNHGAIPRRRPPSPLSIFLGLFRARAGLSTSSKHRLHESVALLMPGSAAALTRSVPLSRRARGKILALPSPLPSGRGVGERAPIPALLHEALYSSAASAKSLGRRKGTAFPTYMSCKNVGASGVRASDQLRPAPKPRRPASDQLRPAPEASPTSHHGVPAPPHAFGWKCRRSSSARSAISMIASIENGLASTYGVPICCPISLISGEPEISTIGISSRPQSS